MTLPMNIQNALMFLIIVAMILLLVIAPFLITLLVNLTNLTKSLQSLTRIVEHELEPTLKEFQKALKSINTIASVADRQADTLNKSISTGMDMISNSTTDIFNKAKVITTSLKQGIITGLKVFMNYRKNK